MTYTGFLKVMDEYLDNIIDKDYGFCGLIDLVRSRAKDDDFLKEIEFYFSSESDYRKKIIFLNTFKFYKCDYSSAWYQTAIISALMSDHKNLKNQAKTIINEDKNIYLSLMKRYKH